MKNFIYDALYKKYKAQEAEALATLEIYFNNPAGIGEHSDIMEAIQDELDKMAVHEDRLDLLLNYFND